MLRPDTHEVGKILTATGERQRNPWLSHQTTYPEVGRPRRSSDGNLEIISSHKPVVQTRQHGWSPPIETHQPRCDGFHRPVNGAPSPIANQLAARKQAQGSHCNPKPMSAPVWRIASRKTSVVHTVPYFCP